MKKNLYKILFMISILLIILGIVYSLKRNYNKTDESTKSNNNLFYDLTSDVKTIDVCVKDSSCNYMEPISYSKLTIKYDIPVLKKRVKEINDTTNKLYKKTLKSNTNSSECKSVKNKYLYQYIYSTNYNLYETYSYISITTQVIKTDLCSNKSIGYNYDALIYDKNLKRVISQKEFQNGLSITDSELMEKINERYKNYCNDKNIQYNEITTPIDYTLFYGSTGEVYASFKIPNTDNYVTSTIRYPVTD